MLHAFTNLDEKVHIGFGFKLCFVVNSLETTYNESFLCVMCIELTFLNKSFLKNKANILAKMDYPGVKFSRPPYPG